MLLDRLALRDGDRAALANEVRPPHTRAARHRPDEEHPVRAIVRLGTIRGCDDPREQRVRPVLELHEHALRLFDHLRDVRETKVDVRIGPEHLPGCDAWKERVRDLTRRPGDDDLYCAHAVSSAPP